MSLPSIATSTVWRSLGTSSVAITTKATAPVTASAGRSQTCGLRGRCRKERSLAMSTEGWVAVVLAQLAATLTQVTSTAGR
ncbi:MAG TPA: hypothetical protein VGS62_09415 [Streptosporangiaceae bacterium]|nr:hypothetical protein [Streptosporangiaceae bacterium]